MPRLPDRFDLWVRRARSHPDPARQLDYVLGALIALPSWYLFNQGPAEKPQPAVAELEGVRHLLVFSNEERVRELMEEAPDSSPIVIPAVTALEWCVQENPLNFQGLLLNPVEDAVAIPLAQVKLFAQEWQARGGRQAAGFWIPGQTSEEEAFWQEHGL